MHSNIANPPHHKLVLPSLGITVEYHLNLFDLILLRLYYLLDAEDSSPLRTAALGYKLGKEKREKDWKMVVW